MLLARIAVTDQVLQSTHEDNCAAQSKIQCSAMLEQFGREGLQSEQTRELAGLIEEESSSPAYQRALLGTIG